MKTRQSLTLINSTILYPRTFAIIVSEVKFPLSEKKKKRKLKRAQSQPRCRPFSFSQSNYPRNEVLGVSDGGGNNLWNPYGGANIPLQGISIFFRIRLKASSYRINKQEIDLRPKATLSSPSQ